MWSSESDEASLHVPVQVSVLHLLVVLILLDVELIEVEEATFASLRQTAQRIQHCQVEGTCHWSRIVLV